MDFDKTAMTKQGYGLYESLDHKLLPNLFIAYRDDFSEPTEVFHNNIRDRFDRGETKVVNAMKYWASLADKAKMCLLKGDSAQIGELLDANFDRRKNIYKISKFNLQMIDTARAAGASAKFTGSGGAIIGTYKDARMFGKIKKGLGKLKIKVLKPRIVSSSRKAML